MPDILTPQEVKGRDLRTNKQVHDYLGRLEETLAALARFAMAADMPLTDAEVAEFWEARKPLHDAGWLNPENWPGRGGVR